jgi:U3 small nucleolar RNA-associated protein 11
LRKGKGKEAIDLEQEQEEDLGWKSTEHKRKRGAESTPLAEQDIDEPKQHSDRRKRLWKELSARLDRDRKLRYAQRELEMQRLIQAVEKIDVVKDDDEEDEDEIEARKGKRRSRVRSMNEKVIDPVFISGVWKKEEMTWNVHEKNPERQYECSTYIYPVVD